MSSIETMNLLPLHQTVKNSRLINLCKGHPHTETGRFLWTERTYPAPHGSRGQDDSRSHHAVLSPIISGGRRQAHKVQSFGRWSLIERPRRRLFHMSRSLFGCSHRTLNSDPHVTFIPHRSQTEQNCVTNASQAETCAVKDLPCKARSRRHGLVVWFGAASCSGWIYSWPASMRCCVAGRSVPIPERSCGVVVAAGPNPPCVWREPRCSGPNRLDRSVGRPASGRDDADRWPLRCPLVVRWRGGGEHMRITPAQARGGCRRAGRVQMHVSASLP